MTDPTVEASAVTADPAVEAFVRSTARPLHWARWIAFSSLLVSVALCIWITAKAQPQALSLPSEWRGTAGDWCEVTANGIGFVMVAATVVSVWCTLGMLGKVGAGISRSTLVAMITAGVGFVLCLAFVMLAAYSVVADVSVTDGRLSPILVATGRPFSLAFAFAANGASALWLRRITGALATREAE